MQRTTALALGIICGLGLGCAAPAPRKAKPKKRVTAEPATVKVEALRSQPRTHRLYSVVRVGSRFRVLPTAHVRKARKTAHKKDARRLARWKQRKAEANAAGKTFTQRKPRPRVFKVVGRPLTTEGEAKLLARKLRIERTAKRPRRRGTKLRKQATTAKKGKAS